MKIRHILTSFLLLSSVVIAEEQIKIEIVEFGIYSRSERHSTPDASAPTGQVFMGGKVTLKEQTGVIPAVLGGKFGFGYSVTGNNGKPVPLTVVYHFPKMTDPQTLKEFSHYVKNVKTIPEEPLPRMLWDFTESWELVPGDWIFQIYQGKTKLVEKKFTVVKK